MTVSRFNPLLRPERARIVLPSILVLSTCLSLAPSGHAEDPRIVRVPEELAEAAGIPAREKAQLASRDQMGVFADFRFTDRVADSGITFRHQIVDDAGIFYNPVHYDHGNGVAAADIDGDGRIDLYFTTQLGRNELWKNQGDGRFTDVTTATVALADRVSVAASFADVDNDGDADLYVTTVRHGNAMFLNDGAGRFTDVTRQAGLEHSAHSSGAVFFDYDKDGRLDLFLTNVGVYTNDRQGRGGAWVGRENAFGAFRDPVNAERSVLYQNLGGGRFRDVSEQVLLKDRSWSGDAAAADVNGDGYVDLYVLNMHGDDHYYENVGGRFFVDRTAKLFPKTPPGTMGVKFFDWNGDGHLDLYLTDMHADMNEDIGPEREKLKARLPPGAQGLENSILGNAFFQGSAEGFVEISDQIGAENYWPWGLSVDDLNGDGWDDAFLTSSMNYPFRYGINSLLLNDRGKTFRDSEFLVGVEPRPTGLDQPWFELDCSPAGAVAAGGADLKAGWKALREGAQEGGDGGAAAQPRHPHCEGQEGRVVVYAARGSRSSVLFDIEGDGDLDIVTSEFNGPPQVLVSNLAQTREIHYLRVELEGRSSNRDGLGAKVEVTAGARTRFKIHDGKSGYLSQSRLPLYFGLGEHPAESVTVHWPSGMEQVVSSPPKSGKLRIVEPLAAEAPETQP